MLRTGRQSARMSKIKNNGLDQYGSGLFEQQQFGTAGNEVVNVTAEHDDGPTSDSDRSLSNQSAALLCDPAAIGDNYTYCTAPVRLSRPVL